jgi:hypothetical protein
MEDTNYSDETYSESGKNIHKERSIEARKILKADKRTVTE